MTTKKITKDLPVSLTVDQRAKCGMRLADLETEQGGIEDELAAFGTEKRKRLREIRKEVRALSKAVKSGVQLQPVVCHEITDHSTNSYTVKRLDTGEEVESRALSGEERQVEIEIGGDDEEAPRRKTVKGGGKGTKPAEGNA